MAVYNCFLKEVTSALGWNIEGGGTSLEAIGKETAEPSEPSKTKLLKSTGSKGLPVTARVKAPTTLIEALEGGGKIVAATMHLYAKTSSGAKIAKYGTVAAPAVTGESAITIAAEWVTLVFTKAQAEELTLVHLEAVSLYIEQTNETGSISLYEMYLSVETSTGVTITPAAVSAVSSSSLGLRAQPNLPLSAASAATSVSMALAAAGLIAGTASAASSASLALAAATAIAPASSSASSSASLGLAATAMLVLAGASGTSSTSFALTAATTITLSGVSAASSSTLGLAAAATLTPTAASASSSTGLALAAATTLALNSASSVSSASVALAGAATISLASASATTAASLGLTATATIPLGTASAGTASSLELQLPAGVTLPLAGASSSSLTALAMAATTQLTLVAATASTASSLTVQATLPNSLAGRITIASRAGHFHIGDLWIPTATITSVEGAVVEPGGITFTFLSHKGVETAGTATKVSTGVWKSSIQLTEAGVWKVSVKTASPYKASQPARIPVKPRFAK